MTVLLDTHVVLWATLDPKELSQTAAKIISDESNVLLVSSVSAWEISNKVRIGKLPHAEALERDFPERMAEAGYKLVPLSVEVALRAGRLVGVHRDPSDRMIAAQALALDIPVISTDTKLDEFKVRRIW